MRRIGFVALVLLLAGCGGGGSDGAPGTTSSSRPAGGQSSTTGSSSGPATPNGQWQLRETGWTYQGGEPPACPEPLEIPAPVDVHRATSILYPGQTRGEYKPHGGFRFDGGPEPEDRLMFLGASQIADGDFVVDLRAPDEGPAVPGARRLSVMEFGEAGPRPAPGQRAVLCCRSGLRSWQAARRLQRVWDGEIRLVAENVLLVATFWLSFSAVRGLRTEVESLDLGRGIHQVMVLIAPFLRDAERAHLSTLASAYSDDATRE